jgi:hypothetical protein
MRLTEILDNKETPAAEKLKQLFNVVIKAREAYGNIETVLTSPIVNSTEGYVDMKYLSAEDKLALAQQQIRYITTEVIAITDTTEGTVFDREFERLLAVNSTLSNLTTTVDSKYL